jgi:hypothetical protein
MLQNNPSSSTVYKELDKNGDSKGEKIPGLVGGRREFN